MTEQGVSVEVENGFARIELIDKSKRGAVLAALLKVAGPEVIDIDTGGTRKTYIVPESIAVQAGILESSDGESPAVDLPEVPAGNASRETWATFLNSREIEFPESANRDELRELYRATVG